MEHWVIAESKSPKVWSLCDKHITILQYAGIVFEDDKVSTHFGCSICEAEVRLQKDVELSLMLKRSYDRGMI